jgi:hypothetical protein
MEARRMFQNVLLAEYHGTFHDTPSNKMASSVNISAQILLHILGFVFCTECHILANWPNGVANKRLKNYVVY